MYPELSVFKESGYLEAIVETSDDGILVVDAEGRFEFGNTSFFRILGWKPEELVRTSIDIARHVARGLPPVDVPKAGLAYALNLLADDTREMCEVACTFTDRGAIAVEENSIATHLSRIAQEALNNAVKHGRPSRIDIELETTDSRGILRVNNDGAQLEPHGAAGTGLGMRIMQHRASAIEGVLSLGPAEAGGVALSCTFANPHRDRQQSPPPNE